MSNETFDFEDALSGAMEYLGAEPEQKVEETVEAEESEVSVDEPSIEEAVENLIEDEAEEADDDPEEESEEEVEDESDDDGDGELSFTYDGEEFTLSAKEVAAMRKDAGRSKALTQKEQEIAETRKQLDKEAEAVAWVKAKPELKELQSQIEEANEAITRGFVLEDGKPVYLTREQIAETKKNVDEAIAEFNSKNKPPMIDELQKVVPEMFSDDKSVVQGKLDSFADSLRSFGYSQAEINVMDDPRQFLMLQELERLRAVDTKVKRSKATPKKGSEKVVSKVPSKKANKPNTGNAQKPTTSQAELLSKVNSGEISAEELMMKFT